jgi:hypothetical protein
MEGRIIRANRRPTENMTFSRPLFGKLAIVARLRSETTLPIKWIGARVQIGTAKGAKSVLHHLAQSQDQRKAARTMRPTRIPIYGFDKVLLAQVSRGKFPLYDSYC